MKKKNLNKEHRLQWYCENVWGQSYINVYDLLQCVAGLSDEMIDARLTNEYRAYIKRSQAGDNLVKACRLIVMDRFNLLSYKGRHNKFGVYISKKATSIAY